MNRSTARAVRIFALVGLVAALPASAQVRVGDVHPIDLQLRDYTGSSSGPVWQHTIHHPGATYVSVHFSAFDLGPGDALVVSDGNAGQAYRLTGRGKMGAGSFWARHIKGDTAVLELTSPDGGQGPGFAIDLYASGFGDVGAAPEAICGVDDKEHAACYTATHPTEYDRARAVARLLINGTFLCTGWLASADNHLITNQHCIGSSSSALNTDYEFMAEAPDCADANCQLCWGGNVIDGATFIQANAGLDYALVQLTTGNPAATYGFLQIDPRQAIVGEQIYIPQHPGGRAKEIAIFSTSDAGGVCEVFSNTSPPCTGSGYNDVGYLCDTEGGSSGSPVLASSNHEVIALHHCANCPNRGVPIDLVHAEIGGLLGPQCTVDAECDDGVFCNGAETCVDGACAPGSDPCPGEECKEETQSCGGPTCDNDGTCETGEDCNNCAGDCISGTAGASCGNGVCETADGESCVTCPSDCNGKTNGPPSGRYCCGDDVGCGDPRCSANGNSCSGFPSGSSCCGDGVCEGIEDGFNCAIDCGPPPCGDGTCDGSIGEDPCSCSADCGTPPGNEVGSCSDGVDNDCDGDVDCADTDCGSDPACECLPPGASCTSDADCCSDKCKGPSSNRTCR